MFVQFQEDFPEHEIEKIKGLIEWCDQELGWKFYEVFIQAYDRRDYKVARKHAQRALKTYKKVDEKIAKEKIPVWQYRIALTYYAEEDYLTAKSRFLQFRKDFPEYESDVIKGLIGKCDKNFALELATDTRDMASKAFNEKNYMVARSDYRDTIKYYKKYGVSDNSEIVAELRYNIAMTYWNEKNWKRAREWLLLLRKKHPTFHKDDVQDLLEKADKFLARKY